MLRSQPFSDLLHGLLGYELETLLLWFGRVGKIWAASHPHTFKCYLHSLKFECFLAGKLHSPAQLLLGTPSVRACCFRRSTRFSDGQIVHQNRNSRQYLCSCPCSKDSSHCGDGVAEIRCRARMAMSMTSRLPSSMGTFYSVKECSVASRLHHP